MSFIEFQPFVAVLGEMGDRIKSQMTELQKAEEKYRSIFENAVEGIFQTTLDGRFLGANPAMAQILGYDSSEKLLESSNDIENQLYVDPERRKEFIRLIRESKMIYGFEAQLYSKNGSKIWVTINARSVYDENGELLFFEGFTEDITERKLGEEKLKKAYEKVEAKVEERTKNLKEKTEKLVRMNKLFVDRELRMKELKEEIKKLKRRMQ
jgi:PAS domain S-box-containing protein